MPARYGNDNDSDDNSHDEDVDSTDFTTKNFNFSKWGPRAEGRSLGLRAEGRGKPKNFSGARKI